MWLLVYFLQYWSKQGGLLLHAAARASLEDILVGRWLGVLCFECYAVEMVCKMRGNYLPV